MFKLLSGGLLAGTIFLMTVPVMSDEKPLVPSVPAVKKVPTKAKRTSVKKKKFIKAEPKSPIGSTVKRVPVSEEKPVRNNVLSWLKELKERVKNSRVKHNQIIAVAAVRGDEAPDSPPLYWKGTKTAGPIEMPELEQFEEALDEAIKGDTDSSKTKLNSFLTTYPKSPLVKEAKEMLAKLKENQLQE